MKKVIIAVAPLALVAACSGGSSEEMQAGQWDMTMQMTSVEAPDMPEEMRTMMESQMGEASTNSECITEEQAANPLARMTESSDLGEDCEFDSQVWEGGVINISGTCASPMGQGESQMSIEGTYDADSVDAEVSVSMEAGPMGAMTMSGDMTGVRTGDCDA